MIISENCKFHSTVSLDIVINIIFELWKKICGHRWKYVICMAVMHGRHIFDWPLDDIEA